MILLAVVSSPRNTYKFGRFERVSSRHFPSSGLVLHSVSPVVPVLSLSFILSTSPAWLGRLLILLAVGYELIQTRFNGADFVFNPGRLITIASLLASP